MGGRALGYDFEIQYRLGQENKAADSLSKMPPVGHPAMLYVPRLVDLKVIKKEVNEDPYLVLILKELEEDPEGSSKFRVQQGMLRY